MLLPDENVTNFYYKCHNIHNKYHNFFTIMHIDFALPL